MDLKIKKLIEHAEMPTYATPGSACFDLRACLGHPSYSLTLNGRTHINTGLAFEVPEGYVMLVFSRSGHGFKNNVRLSNCVGVIDSDYRGEVCVALVQDIDNGELVIKHGDRIAQAMLIKIDHHWNLINVDELTDTERGEGGFGSTGS